MYALKTADLPVIILNGYDCDDSLKNFNFVSYHFQKKNHFLILILLETVGKKDIKWDDDPKSPPEELSDQVVVQKCERIFEDYWNWNAKNIYILKSQT